MEFYKGIIGKMTMEWSFSFNSFVKLSLFKNVHFPMDPKHHVIKGLHCCCFMLFDSLRPSQQIFQLCRDGSSWVDPVLSKETCVLLKDTTQ